MSWLSSGLHKLVKNPITQGVGKIIDVGSDFLPPGLAQVGNVTGKMLQNQNLKTALIGTGMDALGGKIGGMVAGKLGNTIAGAAGNTPSGAMSLAGSAKFDPSNLTGMMSNVVGGAPQAAASNGGGGLGDMIKAGLGKTIGGLVQGQGGNGTGGASAFDWAKLGIDTLGGAAAGAANAKNAQADRDLNKDQFNRSLAEKQAEFGRTQGQSEGQDAFGYQKSMNSAPMRDQAQYLLMQRMGMVPQAFRPHDIYNESYGSGPAQLGGIDPQQMQTAAANYHPGAGGVSTDVERALLARFGFNPQARAA